MTVTEDDSFKEAGSGVVRRFPYPYRAMLAICSDLDETANREVYYELMRFLNTTEETPMGSGIGLEIGNTIYFDMTPDQFAYWNTDDTGREMVRDLIRSGHVDCIHSYGDLATTRAHAARALEELEKHDCRLKVWVDHAVAPTNFGTDIMRGHGDEPGHRAYHADLTLGFGVEYVWRGRVTSIIGQERPPSFAGLWNGAHPLASAETLAKEAAKQMLARCGNEQYAMHDANRVLQPARLRDGSPVLEFLRCNPHWGGVSCGDTGREIGEVLTDHFLETLVQREGACLLYTHLGKLSSSKSQFKTGAAAGFARLAAYARRGKILVTTTRRMLDYLRLTEEVRVSETRSGRVTRFDVKQRPGGRPLEAIEGLTMYFSECDMAEINANGQGCHGQLNAADHTGSRSVSIPWRSLMFPSVTAYRRDTAAATFSRC